jgi:transcription elongation factor GreA
MADGSASQNQDKIHLTQKGLADLKRQLAELKEKRPEVVEQLAETRSEGDEPESQEYTQAKQDLAMLDGRIDQLEEVIAQAVIIDDQGNGSQTISLGSKVTVDLDGQEMVFHLVGEWEANPVEQKVSHKSPLGQQLLGKKPGDLVEVEAPVGRLIYKIVKIG